jgi:hypothetical protein
MQGNLYVDYDVDVQSGGGEEVQVPLPDVPHHDIRPSVLGSQLHRRLLPRNIPGVRTVIFVIRGASLLLRLLSHF